MIKTNVNDSRITLDNSQLQLVRKESNFSWYRSSVEDDASVTPISSNDSVPVPLLEVKTKVFQKNTPRSMMYSANFGSQAEDAIKISSKNNIKPTKIILGHQQT
jgi:hypothetical protein